MIVLRQERDEINFALADERHKNARLLNIEQEKHALLCEINRLQENLQTQRKEVKIEIFSVPIYSNKLFRSMHTKPPLMDCKKNSVPMLRLMRRGKFLTPRNCTFVGRQLVV